MSQQVTDKFNSLIHPENALPAGNKEHPVSVKKVALRELPSTSVNIMSTPTKNSSYSEEKNLTVDSSMASVVTKRKQPDCPLSPSPNANRGVNGHLVYVRRKIEKNSSSSADSLSSPILLRKRDNEERKEPKVVLDKTQSHEKSVNDSETTATAHASIDTEGPSIQDYKAANDTQRHTNQDADAPVDFQSNEECRGPVDHQSPITQYYKAPVDPRPSNEVNRAPLYPQKLSNLDCKAPVDSQGLRNKDLNALADPNWIINQHGKAPVDPQRPSNQDHNATFKPHKPSNEDNSAPLDPKKLINLDCKAPVDSQGLRNQHSNAVSDPKRIINQHKALVDPQRLSNQDHNALFDSQKLSNQNFKAPADTWRLSNQNFNVHADPQRSSNHKSPADPQRLSNQDPKPSVYPQRTSNQEWKERYMQLQMFLKNCDQSSQEDYKRMLRSLTSADRSRHALELEKRALNLLLEEGKELHRMQVLNIIGELPLQDHASPSTSQSHFQRIETMHNPKSPFLRNGW